MFAPFIGKCDVCGRDETPLDVSSNLFAKEVLLKSLLRRAVNQLHRWEVNYGENNPTWLPPSGEVNLLEDIEEALKS